MTGENEMKIKVTHIIDAIRALDEASPIILKNGSPDSCRLWESMIRASTRLRIDIKAMNIEADMEDDDNA